MEEPSEPIAGPSGLCQRPTSTRKYEVTDTDSSDEEEDAHANVYDNRNVVASSSQDGNEEAEEEENRVVEQYENQLWEYPIEDGIIHNDEESTLLNDDWYQHLLADTDSGKYNLFLYLKK